MELFFQFHSGSTYQAIRISGTFDMWNNFLFGPVEVPLIECRLYIKKIYIFYIQTEYKKKICLCILTIYFMVYSLNLSAFVGRSHLSNAVKASASSTRSNLTTGKISRLVLATSSSVDLPAPTTVRALILMR